MEDLATESNYVLLPDSLNIFSSGGSKFLLIGDSNLGSSVYAYSSRSYNSHRSAQRFSSDLFPRNLKNHPSPLASCSQKTPFLACEIRKGSNRVGTVCGCLSCSPQKLSSHFYLKPTIQSRGFSTQE